MRLFKSLTLFTVAFFIVSCSNPVGGTSDSPATTSNQAPSVTGTEEVGGVVGEEIVFDVSVTDPEGDTLTFEWRLASVPGDSSLSPGTLLNGSTLTLAPGLLPDADGEYRVDLVITDGENEVTFSVTVLVTIGAPDEPVLVSPANGANNVSPSVTLDWNAADGAERYDVYLGTSDIFNNATEVASDLTATQFAPDGLQNQQSYYWWIVAENSEGTTRSAGRSFTTVTAAPGAPTSLSPANGHLTNNSSITLRWDSAPRASEYEVHIAPSGGGGWTENVGNATQLTLSNLADDNYGWWVVAINAGGQTGTEPRGFTIDTTPPKRPVINKTPDPPVYVSLQFEFRFSGDSDTHSFECRVYLESLRNNVNTTGRGGGTVQTQNLLNPGLPIGPNPPIIPPGPFPPILQPPAYESCSSPFTDSISTSGEYVFEVRAVDRAGNKSQPRAHVFQVVTLLF